MAKNVIVYSTPSCPWCTKEKEWLKQNGIEFQDVDVSEDYEAATEMITKTGQRGVPVTDVDGTIIVGFDKEALKKALHI